jgi:Fibronectin type III domain
MISRSFHVPLLMAVATSSIAGAALAMNDSTRSVLATSSLGVWFANDEVSSASHVGPTGVDASVLLPNSTGPLHIESVDGVAYVVDATGRAARLDPVQLEVSAEVQLPSTGTQLVGAGGRLYAVDSKSGTVRELDRTGMTTLGAAIEVGADLGLAVVDDNGVLWVPSKATGQVIGVSNGQVTVKQSVAAAGENVQLSVVNGSVVALNSASGKVVIVAGEGKGAAHTMPVAPGVGVAAPDRVAAGRLLPVLSDDHGLAMVDVGTGKVSTADLGRRDSDLGTPVLAGKRVYIPDFTKGVLLVFDVATNKLLDTISVTGQPGRFEVVENAGRVYISDPKSENAWTVDSRGKITKAEKYDPNSPGGASADAGGRVPPAPKDDKKDDERDDKKDEKDDEKDEVVTPTPQVNTPTVIIPPPPVTPPKRDGRPPANPAPAPPQPQPQTQPPAGSGEGSPPAPPNAGPKGDGAVRNVRVWAGDASATVSWEPPAEWREVTGYTVTLLPGGAKHEGPAGESSYTFRGLPNGTEVSFQIVAKSREGNGAAVLSGAVTPNRAAPGAPRNVSATAGDAQVTVSWAEPSSGKVDGYSIDLVPADGSATVNKKAGADDRSTQFSGLKNGVGYKATVRAELTNGSVSAGAESNTVTPAGKPSAPANPQAGVTAPGTVTITWGASTPNGASITGYRITAQGVTVPDQPANATSVAVPGLTENSSHTFSVQALSAAGNSDPAAAPAVTVTRQTPDAPANVGATAGDGSVSLTWTAPNGNGTTVSGYTVIGSDGSSTPAGATSANIPAVNGVTVTYTVVANGANGSTSPSSPISNAVVPSGAPAAPTGVTVSAPDHTSVTVTFSQVSPSNGTDVTGFTASLNGGAPIAISSGHTFTGLSPSTNYTVTVVALGANGRSSQGASGSGATQAPPAPAALTGLIASPSGTMGTRVRISWNASAGADHYIVSMAGADTSVTTTSTTRSTVSDSSYIITVTPVSSAGVAGTPMSVDYYSPAPPDDCGVPNKPICP